MSKQIIKQIFIILLTCIALVLIFALVFYQYIPSNKVIPSKVQAYSTPESIKSEIEEKPEAEELMGQNQLYEITDSDLDLYKSTKSYNPGKSDPFSNYTEESTESSSTTPETKTPNSSSKESDDSEEKNGTGENKSGSNADKNTTDNYYTAANVSKGTK